MVHRIIITIAFTFVIAVVSAQHLPASTINPEARKAWVQSAKEKLRTVQADSTTRRIEMKKVSGEDYFRLNVRIMGEGLLLLPGKNFIYFLTTSAHDRPDIGDISLAIDHRGRMYQNNGHVCGGIIHFECGTIREVNNSSLFFEHFVSDTDGEGWRRIH